MRLTKIFLIFLCALVWLPSLKSQIAIGEWRDHLSYRNVKKVIEADNKIYGITESGAMLYYNKTDNSLNKFSTVHGLSDIGVISGNYYSNDKTLVIGYKNGNINLIKKNNILTISDIKDNLLLGNKNINNIFILNNKAYLACGFGIVVIDLNRKEIKETYYLGDQGSKIEIFDITYDENQYLYAATREGVYRADINNPNLIDYNNWEKLDFLPNADKSFNHITYFNNNVYANYASSVDTADVIYRITGNTYDEFHAGEYGNCLALKTCYNTLAVITNGKADFYNSDLEIEKSKSIWDIQDAIKDNEGSYWLGMKWSGLYLDSYNDYRAYYSVPGPFISSVVDISIENNILWAAGGSKMSPWSRYGAFTLSNNEYTNINYLELPELSGVYNISLVKIDPADPSHAWGGSHGYGIVEFRNNEVETIYDETNSVLKNIEGFDHGYIRITGMDNDSENNLWIVQSEVKDPLHVHKADNNEMINISFDFPGFGFNQSNGELVVTDDDHIWFILKNGSYTGIFSFDYGEDIEDDSDYREKFFHVKNQNGKQFNKILTLNKDMEGNIWVGTSEGPVVYYNPEEAFSSNDFKGQQILIARDDDTDLADYLLGTSSITSIAIDGANRKWFGTQFSGAYLISEDEEKEIQHFTMENSPLLSNTILNIEIDQITGEVFFATDQGMISYRSDAISGKDDFSEVYVFPNPVREDYTGPVTITNLVENANVKITDISGNLVFETTGKGGMATWDGANFLGDRVHTGVYLVFCTNEDGSKTHVTKLLFIH